MTFRGSFDIMECMILKPILYKFWEYYEHRSHIILPVREVLNETNGGEDDVFGNLVASQCSQLFVNNMKDIELTLYSGVFDKYSLI